MILESCVRAAVGKHSFLQTCQVLTLELMFAPCSGRADAKASKRREDLEKMQGRLEVLPTSSVPTFRNIEGCLAIYVKADASSSLLSCWIVYHEDSWSAHL